MNDLMVMRSIEKHLELIEDELASQIALLQTISHYITCIANKQGIPTIYIDGFNHIKDDNTIQIGTNGVQE